jgi:carbon storage regulator CsrA
MLVITRKTDESIVIEIPADVKAGVKENTVEITIIETGKDKVRLGVKAPREFKIIRNELVLAENSNVEASKSVSKGALDALMKISGNVAVKNLEESKESKES